MSIASKCTCGKSISGICTNAPGCDLTIVKFFTEHQCTNEEKKALKAFLFAYRHNDIDITMLERIIEKYASLL